MPSHAQQKQLSREKEKKRDNSPSFTWPEYILYEGTKVYASGKFPTFARYMLSSSQMNRSIIVSRDQYLRHLEATGYYD